MLQSEVNSNISLRAARNEDIEILYKAINDPKIVKYNSPYEPIHEENHIKWFEKLSADKTKIFFVIDFDKTVVGSAQLIDIHPIHRSAEITIRLFAEKNFGKGIGFEAINLLSSHAFNNLNLKRIWLRVFKDNLRAIRCYEKNHFIKEGVLRRAAFIDGVFKDMVILSRISDD